jgi:hypothetical protein
MLPEHPEQDDAGPEAVAFSPLPSPVSPGPVSPEPSESHGADLQSAEFHSADSHAAEARAVESESAEPQATEPEATEPEPAETQPAGNDHPDSYPSGWYADYADPDILRYWDGAEWTEHTHPATADH